MFVIREALPSDLRDIGRLAAIFDTVNLPDDKKVLATVVAASRRAFGGLVEPLRREYLFVLEDRAKKKVVGTAMIIAQHGTKQAPHLYFDVLEEERYSETLGKHFKHLVLRLGANYDGPTEIGGLILAPEYRGDPHQLGKQLSYVRFLFMGMHPERFRPTVIAELLPPLEEDGKSQLWEHLGRKFTDLGYQEADRISQRNKEFIRTLFPHSAIYASLFPKSVQKMIGTVGPATKGVEKMLRRIGFTYSNRIDPFDGGPHYEARLRAISVVRRTRALPAVAGRVHDGEDAVGLCGVESGGRVRFRAVRAVFRREPGRVVVPALVLRTLGAREGDVLWSMPFPESVAAAGRRARTTAAPTVEVPQ